MFSHHAALAGSYQNYSHLCQIFCARTEGIFEVGLFSLYRVHIAIAPREFVFLNVIFNLR